MKYHADHQYNELVKQAVAVGWRCEPTNAGHYKLIPPDPLRPVIFLPGTSCSKRGFSNFKAMLKRNGVQV